MSRLRLLPYRSLAPCDVSWGEWWLERDGIRSPLPDLLPGWDYASREVIGISVDVTDSAILEKTGLTRLDLIEAVAIADCPATFRRFLARQRLSPKQQVDLAVELPPGEIAQRLELSTFLILADDITPVDRVASKRGSRLCSGPTRALLLEGDSSRFPTEVVPFSGIHIEHAPWTISAMFDDLTDSFMGSIRLLVNEEHELGRELLTSPVSPSLETRVKVEVVRSLVAIASMQDVSDDVEFPDDSVGAVIDAMCRRFFNFSIHEAIHVYRQNPLKFDRILYAGVGE